jgi:ankyrin repeat protein
VDAKFEPAIAAVRSGDLAAFTALIRRDPSLATARSARSHPTLLQCAVLDGKGKPNNVAIVRVLIDAGAPLDEPLIAAVSVDNAEAAALLLDRGAAIDGTRGWSPLEEALYWNSRRALALLLERGARVGNLRIAAGLGRVESIAELFHADGTLTPQAGRIDWPWGGVEAIERSNLDDSTRRQLAERVRRWPQDRQAIVDNAFVYACMHGHVDAAELLLKKGAAIDAIPAGFDYAGTGLHYAAMNGQRAMVELLLQRDADPTLKDPKVGADAAGWAEHGGQTEIRDLLRRAALRRRAERDEGGAEKRGTT